MFCEIANHLRITQIVATLHGVLVVGFYAVAFNAQFLLNPVTWRIHFAPTNEGITADNWHLLDDHHGFTGLGCFDCRTKACTPCSDNDHIIGLFAV